MNQEVLVTGSSRGIGAAVALALANVGYDIVLHCNTNHHAADEIAERIRSLGRAARVLQFDVADREKARSVLEEDLSKFGAYFGVVCNAGIHDDAAFPALSPEAWDRVIHTNLDGFYNVMQPIIMPMVRARRGGRIVVMSSVSGLIGNRGQVNYSAAKGGLVAASKALAVELASRKITVNCIAPGLIETDMTENLDNETIARLIPMRRMGTTEEVASLVAYLFSPSAAYITRQVISINGGMF